MHGTIGGPRPDGGTGRKLIAGLVLGLIATSPARAGAIRHDHVVSVKATLQASSVDPFGAYWTAALQHHWMHVKGPRALTILSLSADGTLPASPFVEYLQWRQSLHAKVFDSFHPDIAQILKKVAHTPTLASPSPTPVTPGGPVPIQPPDFTPITPTIDAQGLNPPAVPEPASGLLALAMIGAVASARRRRKGGA